MTSEPLASGAPAIILWRQVDRDDRGETAHENNFVRIKILKEEGRKYADVEIPFFKSTGNNVVGIKGRTIRPDGSVVEYSGKVFDKSIVKAKGVKYMAKRMGDRASSQRWALRNVTNDADRIKPIENLLAGSVSNFRITKVSVINLTHSDQPFGFHYTFEVNNYAKNAGNLLLVRPRVLGSKARAILETKEPRRFPIEFERPLQDTDNSEIVLPAGYEVDELPPPVDADFSFASYHSRTELKGNVIGYTRTFELKELSVPVSKTDELKKFYRIIASDERNTAVLKPAK